MLKMSARKGFAIPLTIVAAIVVLGFVFSMTTLNQGLKTQVFQTNNQQLSFIMAYSAYSRLVAKIHTFSWAERPFLNAPYVENRVALQGGYYDLLAEDTWGKNFQADIYIRTELAGIKKLYYWRIKFNDDILDVSNRIIVEAFLNGDPNDFPTTGGPRPLAGRVNNVLAERKQNQQPSDQLAHEISKLKSEKEILNKLAGKTPEDFTQSYPSDPNDELPEDKPLVGFPIIPAITTLELPTNLAGSPSNNPQEFPQINTGNSASTESLNNLSNLILQTSNEMNELNQTGWDQMRNEGRDPADQTWQISDEKKSQAYNAIDSMVSLSAGLLIDAPSDEARKAIEEMVSQSVAAGLGNMGDVLQRHLEHLREWGDGVIYGLSTSTEAERVAADWLDHYNNLKVEQDRVNATASSISGYAKSDEIAGEIANTQRIAREAVEAAKKYLDMARDKIQELRAKEAEERSRQREAEENAN